jgi:N-acyl-D-aspartate/D-glutamate deacylase
VVVNGVIALRGGHPTGSRSGRVLKHQCQSI